MRNRALSKLVKALMQELRALPSRVGPALRASLYSPLSWKKGTVPRLPLRLSYRRSAGAENGAEAPIRMTVLSIPLLQDSSRDFAVTMQICRGYLCGLCLVNLTHTN